MMLKRRLLTPRVASTSLGVHKNAESTYRVWSSLTRQFGAGSLTSGLSPTTFQLNPLHAVRDSHEFFHIFAGFSAYQSLLPSLSATKNTQALILCYFTIDDFSIEQLSLIWLLDFIEHGCLDRCKGLEGLRTSLLSQIDKRILELVCGTSRMSRPQFASRAGVSPSVLKAQATKTVLLKEERVAAKDYVLMRLRT